MDDRHVYDAIVAGAGPAGSRIARDLARTGLDVLILEEHPAVGVPCHCSGLVTPRTLARAGVGDQIVLNPIRGAVIHLGPDHSFTVGGDRVHAHVIDRVALDRALVAQALEAGAELSLGTRLLDYTLEGRATDGYDAGAVVVRATQAGTEIRLRGRLLIGADGARSSVARQVRGGKPERIVAGLGGRADYASPRADHVEVFVDHEAAPGWFGWTIPLGSRVARVGTGSANGVRPIESLARLRRRFPDSFGLAEMQTQTGGGIAIWEPTPMVADRVLLVGDAARQVKPTSGGGIFAALHAAELAAETARAALDRGDLSRRGLRSYPERWHASIGREMRRGHDLRRIFTKLDEQHFARITESLAREDVRYAVDAAGDIDFPSRMAWAFARHAPSLAMRLATLPRFPAAWLRTGMTDDLATGSVA